MDLIYMDADKVDIGVLQNYELDLAYGEDENNFECTLSAKSHCCRAGYYLYIDGTEYGGVVDGIESNTGTDDVVYTGRTWHGILGSKVIVPLQKGETSTGTVTLKTVDSLGNSLVDRYLIISGDANRCIQFLLERIGLTDMFETPGNLSGVSINSYQFNRYTDAYSGIRKMLASAGLKMKLTYTNGKVVISVVERYDYSKDDSFDSDLIDFSITKKYKTVNHLICLGKGELEKRLVIHLFADAEGNISQTQTQFGLDEYTAVYDYSNVESEEELLADGIDELKELWSQDELSMDFDESMDAYDVGDIVGGIDNITGVSAASTITKKIVTIKNGKISIELSTDNVTESGQGSTGNGAVTEYDAQTLGGKAPEYYLTPVNLLDNSNFLNPINQRGYVSGTTITNVYFIDRWSVSDESSFAFDANGIAINSGFCHQIVSISKLKSGHVYTLACKINGNILCYNAAMEEQIGSWEDGLVSLYYAGQGIAIYLTKANATYEWVALYEGAYTVDTLPPYVPKGYAVELAECQRYAYVIGGGVWLTGFHVVGHGLVVPLEISALRPNNAPTVNGAYQAFVANTGWIDITLNSIGYDYATGRVHNLVFQPPTELSGGSACIVTGIIGIFNDL